MAEIDAVSSAGSNSANVQNTTENKNTARLFGLLLSSMMNESAGSIADFSNLNGSDSDSGLLGGTSSLMGSSSMMNTLMMMLLLSNQSGESGGSGINANLLMQMMGMDSTSSALSSMGSSALGASGYTQALQTSTTASMLTSYLNQYRSAGSAGSIPAASWVAANPGIVSHVGERSASDYRAVINQFNVEDNERYRVNKLGQNDTYCNIFAWDVSRAMGAEIPHYINAATGEPAQAGSAGAVELDANAVNDWLNTYGKQYGWVQVGAEDAQAFANQGMPAITSWKNSNGHGHMQVVSPSQDGGYDAARGVAIAQAGEHLYNYNYITAVYGQSSLKNVQYFVHI